LGVFQKGLSLRVAAYCCDEAGSFIIFISVELAFQVLRELNCGALERHLQALVSRQASEVKIDQLGQIQEMPGV
jgi:hypothetical protein